MSEQRKKILEMLSEGKISTDEAERLIMALESNESTDTEDFCSNETGKKPKFLHVKVTEGQGRHENVDIKIPIMLLKAGMKIGSLMPDKAKGKFSSHLNEKGINLDLNNLDSKDIDSLILALSESSIDINSDKEKVRIFCS